MTKELRTLWQFKDKNRDIESFSIADDKCIYAHSCSYVWISQIEEAEIQYLSVK